jgi:hypothetical protein
MSTSADLYSSFSFFLQRLENHSYVYNLSSPSQLTMLDVHTSLVLQCIVSSTAFDRVDGIRFWE